MRSKTVAELLSDIGVTKSHSRPRTSNDNPFSEAQFKTLKYCPFFPGDFASIAEGREFLRLFFRWYNEEHHHSGIAMLTPSSVHGVRVGRGSHGPYEAAFERRGDRCRHGKSCEAPIERCVRRLDVWLAYEVLCNGPLGLLDSMQFLEPPLIGLLEVDHRPEEIA